MLEFHISRKRNDVSDMLYKSVKDIMNYWYILHIKQTYI